MIEKNIYWDITPSLSYNALFNFIVGARSAGKTFGAKQWAIKDFLKNKKEFIYLRRYKTELKTIKNFFNDIAFLFPECEFLVKPPNFYINGKLAGTAIALTTSKIEKSTSFPNVNKIIFDEFIIENTGAYRYLKDEITNFFETYSTIARLRDDVRVYFLSNALSITNPYFTYFDVKLNLNPNKSNGIWYKNDILTQVIDNEDFKQYASERRFGKLIKNTSYGNYAINNNFLLDNNYFIGRKEASAKCMFIIIYQGEIFGFWWDFYTSNITVSKDIDPSCKNKFTMSLENLEPNIQLIKSKNNLWDYFLKIFQKGQAKFESIDIKNKIISLIKLTY